MRLALGSGQSERRSRRARHARIDEVSRAKMPSTLRYGMVWSIAPAAEAVGATLAPVKRPGDSVGTWGATVSCQGRESVEPDGFFARA